MVRTNVQMRIFWRPEYARNSIKAHTHTIAFLHISRRAQGIRTGMEMFSILFCSTTFPLKRSAMHTFAHGLFDSYIASVRQPFGKFFFAMVLLFVSVCAFEFGYDRLPCRFMQMSVAEPGLAGKCVAYGISVWPGTECVLLWRHDGPTNKAFSEGKQREPRCRIAQWWKKIT